MNFFIMLLYITLYIHCKYVIMIKVYLTNLIVECEADLLVVSSFYNSEEIRVITLEVVAVIKGLNSLGYTEFLVLCSVKFLVN